MAMVGMERVIEIRGDGNGRGRVGCSGGGVEWDQRGLDHLYSSLNHRDLEDFIISFVFH